MEKQLNSGYWSTQYQSEQTQWDAGAITTPIKEYIDGLDNKDIAVLVPGLGRGYELLYLYNQGFTNLTGLDFAPEPLRDIRTAEASFPEDRLICSDFFLHQGQYDLILEQTFFCALTPKLREEYQQQMHRLLKPGGKLVGLLFDFPLTEVGPPFGGSEQEYRNLFANRWKIQTMKRAYNSIKPRAGKELFIIIEKKDD